MTTYNMNIICYACGIWYMVYGIWYMNRGVVFALEVADDARLVWFKIS